ncbi:RNA-processing protein [Candidatus Woesearchaeota archaeon CG10_big_fil_rev_8_21_14_0_10_36_11]|nr:MAG: RNA-processing protein [Candidatus Woesearchaeota archaeon CG10_big_fil_rev_8_21_14_0_10_36_11]
MEDEFAYELKIPEERVAVLIGKDGITKKEIEEATGCTLNVTKEGDVTINGQDGLALYNTKHIVKAIARGFNPKVALLLANEEYAFELIDMKEIAGKSQNTMQRLKGRVIGKEGKSREEIERLTDCHISVYGKTIGIIGDAMHVSIARQAVAMLLQGSMHKTVFSFLEKKKKETMMSERV